MKQAKKTLFCLALLLGTVLTIQAQTAFYLYQKNDRLDGYFYDQVKEIRCSTFDTLGIKHSDYVSQEIVTADSVYRIMLNDIDSVCFVEPEVIYNPRLINIDEKGLKPYLVAASGLTLSFSTEMPNNLCPKVGDVLACFSLADYPEGFVGKVKYVSTFDDKLIVMCEKVSSFGDVFQQFIGIEQISVDQQGNARRRSSKDNIWRRVEGNTELELFHLPFSVEDNYQLSDRWELGMNIHGGLTSTASIVYKVTWNEFYIKTQLKNAFELAGGVSLTGKIGEADNALESSGLGSLLMKFAQIPFPAAFPLLSLRPAPIPFFRGEAAFKIGLDLGVQSKCIQQSVTLMSKSPYIDVVSLIAPWLPRDVSNEGKFDLTAELSGMVQVGIKAPMVIKTADWMSNIVEGEVGGKVYAGPKLSGSITLDLLNAFSDKRSIYSGFKESKLDLTLFSIDSEVSAKMQGFFSSKPHEKKVTYGKSFGNMSFKLFPEIDQLEYEIIGDDQRSVKASVATSGDVFMPQNIGIALFNEKDELKYKQLRTEVYSPINTFNSVNAQFDNIEPGKYKIMPFISVLGLDVPVYEKKKEIEIGDITLSVSPNIVEFDKKGGSSEVSITCLTDELYASADKQWITATIKPGSTPTVSISVEQNSTDNYREGHVEVRGVYNNGKTYSELIEVRQFAGITLAKSELEFDEEGGTETVAIMTDLPNINISTNEEATWIHPSLNGTFLSVKVDENKGASREGVVTLGALEGTNIVTAALKIKQIAPITLSVSGLSFPSEGSYSQEVVTYTGDITDVTASSDVKWLSTWVYAADKSITITCLSNNKYSEVRKGIITITAKAGEKDVTAIIEVIQLGAEYVSTYFYMDSEIEIDGNGEKNNIGIYTDCPYITIKDKPSWLSYSWDADEGYLYMWGARNNTGEPRSATIKVVASNGDSEYDNIQEVVVTQGIPEPLETYDGFVIGLRYNGDAHDEIMGYNNTYTNWIPYYYPNIGHYGTGTANENASYFSSHQTGNKSWDAEFIVSDAIYGNFKYVTVSGDSKNSVTHTISFTVNGMPKNGNGPTRFGERVWHTWEGTGSYDWVYRGEAWWLSEEELSRPVYVSNYSDVTVTVSTDEETNVTTTTRTENTAPVQVNVCLRRSNGGGELPYGHPNRQTQ